MGNSSSEIEPAGAPPASDAPGAYQDESVTGVRRAFVGAKSTPRGTAGLLAATGQLPAFKPGKGGVLDPSPLAGLSSQGRARRLLGLLELFASWGDAGAAAEALRHHRWAREMRVGRAPQRVEVKGDLQLTVLDTLSAPAGTPLPPVRKRPGDAQRQAT